MNRRSGPQILTTVAVVAMVVAVVGFIATLALNAFVFDEYDAYGEVPIPGSASVHLPAGDVTVSFHTQLIGSTSGTGLPVPPLKYRIGAPDGVAEPQLTEDYGSTTTVNNDARVRIGYLHVPVEGDYEISTDGNVSAYLSPRLAFGHGSSYGHLPMIFAAIFGLAVVFLLVARFWAARMRRSAPAVGFPRPTATFAPYEPAESFTPTGQGVRIEQLKSLARLRDSGALTESEYKAEKKRVLDEL
jgi:hypothetical protein